MTLREAIELFRDHQKNSAKEKTRESYDHLFRNLEALLGDAALEDISSQDLYQFLLLLTEGRARSTARLRYAQLKSFFNFIIEGTHTVDDQSLQRPPSFEDIPGSPDETTGDHQQGSDRRDHLPVPKDEGQAHPGAPGALRHEDRGGTGFTGIGRERKKTDLKAAEVGPG